VRTAHAKGLSQSAVVWRHIVRNAVTPLLTISPVLLGSLLTGTLFVERIFNIPGYGNLNYVAFIGRDYPFILANCVVAGAIAIAAYLVTDILYAIADPRVKLGGGANDAATR
jgi:ABC-type dipeptide/oligopeptide/nickel transport system permease component